MMIRMRESHSPDDHFGEPGTLSHGTALYYRGDPKRELPLCFPVAWSSDRLLGSFAGNSGRAKERRADYERRTNDRRQRRAPTQACLRLSEKRLEDAKHKMPLRTRRPAQEAFHQNRERLREERTVREAAESAKVAPTPESPDDTPIQLVRFSARI
jgi:hypothetical protein